MKTKIFSVETREKCTSLIEECVIGTVVQAAMLDTTDEAQRIITLYLDSGMTEAWFTNPHAKKVFASTVRQWRETHLIDVYLVGEACGETDFAMTCGELATTSANAPRYKLIKEGEDENSARRICLTTFPQSRWEVCHEQ